MNSENKICPISFIGNGKLETDDRLNSLFLMPFETKMVGDFTIADCIHSNRDDVNDHVAGCLRAINMEASSDVIISYIMQNTVDLCTNTMIQFIDDVMYIINKENDLTTTFGFDLDKLNDVVRTNIMGVYYTLTNNVQLNYCIYEEMMNRVFAHLVAQVYNDIVVEFTSKLVANNEYVVVYKRLFENVYDAPCNSMEGKDISLIYTFISSIIRDILQNRLIDLRKALIMVANSAARMTISSNNMNRLISDSKYTPEMMINDNLLLTNRLKSLITDKIEEKENDK